MVIIDQDGATRNTGFLANYVNDTDCTRITVLLSLCMAPCNVYDWLLKPPATLILKSLKTWCQSIDINGTFDFVCVFFLEGFWPCPLTSEYHGLESEWIM